MDRYLQPVSSPPENLARSLKATHEIPKNNRSSALFLDLLKPYKHGPNNALSRIVPDLD